jgi:hypothetical protein
MPHLPWLQRALPLAPPIARRFAGRFVRVGWSPALALATLQIRRDRHQAFKPPDLGAVLEL